jgi:hypothetical protein
MSIIKGKARWFKVLGEPVDGYVKPGMKPDPRNKEWSFDLVLSDVGVKAALKNGVPADKIKTNKDGESVIKFRRRAIKADGNPAKPIDVFDDQGKPWDRSKAIGNDSVINVMFSVRDTGGIAPISVQIWEHVPYEAGAKFPTRDEMDDFAGKKVTLNGEEEWT